MELGALFAATRTAQNSRSLCLSTLQRGFTKPAVRCVREIDTSPNVEVWDRVAIRIAETKNRSFEKQIWCFLTPC